MKLSIIVPVYNKEKYLYDCISSILNQTKKDIELVLVDDGSTDTSAKICDEWEIVDKRVKAVHKKHEGTLIARIEGINYCSSKYVTFVDADDFVDNKSFEYADRYMEQNIDIICFGISRYFNESYSVNEICNYNAGIYNREKIINSIVPSMIWDSKKGKPGLDPSLCVKVIKRELLFKISQCMNKCNLDIGDDMVLLYPCVFYSESIAISDIIYYMHRQRKGNDIAPYIAQKDYFDKLYFLYDLLRKNLPQDEFISRQIEQVYLTLLRERRCLWEYEDEFIKFLFPFDKVPVKRDIALYGAGKVGSDFFNQLTRLSYCKKILWVDKDWETIDNKAVSSPEEVYSSKVDYIVIAVLAKEVQQQITEDLVAHGIKKEIIVTI